MSTTNQSLPQKDPLSARNLRRAILVVGVLLIFILLAFIGYYYWDRFAPRGAPSPAEVAIQEAEQAVKEDPQNPALRLALSRLYFENRLYSQALEQAQQLLLVEPDNQEALLIAGMSNVRLEQPSEAIPSLLKVIDARKDAPTARSDMMLEMVYYFTGESYNKTGHYHEAIPQLEAALVIMPTDADAQYQLGLAYQGLGQHEEALEHFREAVRFVPDFAEAYQRMVESYAALHRPGYVEYAQGMLAFTEKDYRTAEAHLLKAVNVLPEFVPALLGLGLTYEKLGNLTAAQEILQKAISIDPNDMASRQALGRVHASLEARKTQEQSK
jgi:tetratricopeptide (TPR) repeat protein